MRALVVAAAVLGGLLSLALRTCVAQADGGGDDVRVALFSARRPVSVVVSPAGPGAWWAACLTCRHEPLTGPVRMPGVLEMVAGGPVTVRDQVQAQERTANGQWHLRMTHGQGLDVVLTIPSERYVDAAVKVEAGADDPREALRAMAVVARTYALRAAGTKPAAGHLASDVCDGAACGAIKLGPVSDAIGEAVRSTAGETLWFRSQRAQAIFSGSCGVGHGLCPQGATAMARAGKGYREILAFYFPGTAVRITRSDEGWQQGSHDGIRFMSASALAPVTMEQAAAAWRFANERFSIRQGERGGVMPNIVFAPTTEVFRQMTLQPGWQLASTAGSTIVLQPLAVIAANRTTLAAVLQHEMLHVAVETSASAKAPLWLREGLVEVLAGDASHAPPQMSAEETERLLQGAGSRAQSLAAHRDAGARARLLVERYGMPAVRGWLTSGAVVPAS